jgi:cyclic pyranopterin phosphate synthase
MDGTVFPPETRGAKGPLIDPFGRAITYLRVSVTDRCDFRCTYCMSEDMTFLPKADLLTLEELDRLCTTFVRRGVTKLRLTGGEPLVRRGFIEFVEHLARHLDTGALEELTMTTNGGRLALFAERLAKAGMKRINVSLDTLDRDTFARIARRDMLPQVLQGIEAAKAAGVKVKINAVALAHDNAQELPALIAWSHQNGHDITLIETMPVGEVEEDRTDQYLALDKVRRELEGFWTLTDLPERTGGPARYVRVEETGGKLGFITPLSHNFCEACNRVRVTCTGTLFMCLGQDDAADLRAPLRASSDDAYLDAAIDEALTRKPKGHDFVVERLNKPSVARHMSTTGG